MYKFNKENIKEYNKLRKTKQKNILCKAPYANLYFSRTGDVLACCFNRDFVLGTYPTDTLKEIWEGAKSTNFKKTLKKNQMPIGCDICIRELKNKNYNGVIARQFDFLNRTKNYPVMMEFELDNICNLECVMCEGELSSKIRTHREGKDKIETPYNDNFIDYISPFLKRSKLLRFGGGEPFLIPLYYKIWDIVLKENPKCEIYVQTNGTIINNRIRDCLASGQFQLGVSLDSLNKERFESIRVNAKLNDVLNNIDEFIRIIPKKSYLPSLVISSTVLRENWKDIPELLNFANRINAQIVFNTVWTPKAHAIHNLDSSSLQEIVEFYLKHPASTKNQNEIHNSGMYLGLINQVKDWHTLATEKEQTIKKIKTLSIEELEKNIWELFTTQEQDISLIHEKLTHLLLSLQQRNNYRKYLETIYILANKITIQTLQDYTQDELIKKLEQEIN